MSYTGKVQVMWPNGTLYPYPHVKVYVYHEDREFPEDICDSIEMFRVLIIQYVKVGNKSGNIIFQVSECVVLNNGWPTF